MNNNDSNFDPFQQDGPFPQTLDSNNTNLPPLDEGDNPRRKIIIFGLLAAALIGCCVILVVGFFIFQPDQLSALGQLFPSATATFTRTPVATATITPSPTSTPTPTPNMTATAAALEATDTALAYQATATNAAGTWRTLIKDTFDSNKNKWLTKTSDDEYAVTTYTIADGKYTWDATAHKPFIGWVTANSKSVGDFYLSVEVKQPSGPDSADYGVIFREDVDSNFYYFGMNEQGQYVVYLYNKEWSALIDWTESDFIKPGESNRITVVGEGSHFTFFINDQYLAEITDDTIKKGQFALAVELANENDEGTFEFDNFELHTP